MLYLLYGIDKEKAREKMHILRDSLIAKKPDASVTYVDSGEFETGFLEELIEGQGLFEAKRIIILDNVFADKNGKETFVALRKEIGASSNIFLLLEGELDKTTLTKLEKVAEKTECFGQRKKEGKQKGKSGKKETAFNTFSLADALGERNRKKLWTLLQEAKRNGLSDEEIHGIFFWQIKNMNIVVQAKSPTDTKLNPFVYRKTSAFIKNYSQDELKVCLKNLIELSHDARRGKHDFSIALERFTLGV